MQGHDPKHICVAKPVKIVEQNKSIILQWSLRTLLVSEHTRK